MTWFELVEHAFLVLQWWTLTWTELLKRNNAWGPNFGFKIVWKHITLIIILFIHIYALNVIIKFLLDNILFICIEKSMIIWTFIIGIKQKCSELNKQKIWDLRSCLLETLDLGMPLHCTVWWGLCGWGQIDLVTTHIVWPKDKICHEQKDTNSINLSN